MNYEKITNQLLSFDSADNQVKELQIASVGSIWVYPLSVNQINDNLLFIGNLDSRKYLWIISKDGNQIFSKFQGTALSIESPGKYCPLNTPNANVIRELFSFTKPALLGNANSFGFGDRLGLASPAHIRSIKKTDFKPIIAQQSIRELDRTQREAIDVMDAATWAVFQEGYKSGFGSDADHLKTPAEIDRMMAAGFTMYTIDPGAYVVNDASKMTDPEIEDSIKKLDWEILKDTSENFLSRYCDKKIVIDDEFSFEPQKKEVSVGLVKYGKVIAHCVKMYKHLKEKYSDKPFEIELSIDETESATTPFEHYLVVNELVRLGVELVSVAPRFIGDFEKGIDYKGDLDLFKKEYIQHVKISKKLGNYKISIHSGSDKFDVYKVIGSLNDGKVHVKTSGTSYLEALRTVAKMEPDLLREILKFACIHFETERQSYHISAQLKNIPPAEKCTDADVLNLFDQLDARQLFHVTFGKVLSSKDDSGKYLFKDKIFDCLIKNENMHYEILQRHFKRHLDPFNSMK
jgi:tagaturonate epimerase